MSKTAQGGLADAIREGLVSPNEHDSNYEVANVVDSLFFIGRAIHRLAESADAIATGLRMISDSIDHADPR